MAGKQKIIVGMSGGVDSSVAAMLLLEQGFEVEGLFMKNWEDDDDDEYCAAERDLTDARSVCDDLDIKLHTVNFSSEYWNRVFKYFLEEYKAGRTPNPDVLCNKEIKFRAFLDHAITLGADKIATGHYARIQSDKDKTRLLRGLDTNKDQSYFLYMLNQDQLMHSLFPIGEYKKDEIRSMAKNIGLTTHDKKDSTGICFIGERRFNDFIEQYLPANPGTIKNTDNETLGQHNGLMYYTIGQRKGIGIGGLKDSTENPWYVVDKDIKNNILVVAQGHDHPRMLHKTLECSQLHWIDKKSITHPMDCSAKIRYRQDDQTCHTEQINNNSLRVIFDKPQRAITPGQSIVFYNNEDCLGGGIIESMYNNET